MEETERWNLAAERYFAAIKTSPALLNKPFHHVSETPLLLYKLGILLANLDVGVDHTVLDFGAGACWISALLNRLGCRTIALDVSPTAIELGRRAFELDRRQKAHLGPRFLTYDGHRFPLEDASVDRIVCFDAFHHVPNPQEILDEMWRVLREGGRAGFAEVGADHSHSPQSISEMEKHGVLEDDFIVEDFWAKAAKAGFSQCLVQPYANPGSIALDVKSYTTFLGGGDRAFPLDLLRQDVRHNSFVTLLRGQPVYDSRNPRTLAAKLLLLEVEPRQARPGAPLLYTFIVTNTGDTTWLATPSPEGGFVNLGAHLLDAAGEAIDYDFHRTPLAGDLAPFQSARLQARLHAPAEPGTYLLEFDLVDENVAWFATRGSETARVTLTVGAD
ncbi:MAG: methyltransferase domain-containing protein [Candidatus Rokubacteria bacterium]|nr:methyltransferase domain-containing protein [Candidatus Rokubacteria bacterium]